MRNIILNISCYIVLISFPLLSFAQVSSRSSDKNVITDAQTGSQVFKASRSLTDQTETLEINSIGLPTISASNVADGTELSYSHKFRIVYPLVVSNGKGTYQLVFYGEDEKIPYAVNTEGGTTNIFLPFSVHEYFKSKLDQSLTARKKVQLKLSILTNGIREATWVL